METPPKLNATAQPIEPNENKMSCRATPSPRQLIAVLQLRSAAITALTAHVTVGEPVQFGLHQREQLLKRSVVSAAPVA